jgi:hypothetical protein
MYFLARVGIKRELLINLILKGIKDENITVWIKRRDL